MTTTGSSEIKLGQGWPRAKEPQEMMKNRLEDLWKSADDGAYSPVGPLAIRSEEEFDELLDAWYIERQNSIEFEILLSQSCKLIKQLLSDGDVSVSGQRRARRLIMAISRSLKTAHADEG